MDKIEKVCLITGAGKGIGREFTLSLLRNGYSVAACSRTESDLINLSKQVEERMLSDKFICKSFDVRHFEATQSFIIDLENKFGRLDCVIINAGVSTENSTLENADLNKWIEAIEINLIGAAKTAKAVIPALKKKGSGNIIFIGSGLGHRGMPGTSSYSCSKSGLWMLTKILAQELIEYNILVNELIPGPVKTQIDRSIDESRTAKAFSNEWNKNPEDVLPLLNFMLSFDETGPTGQTFSLTRREI